ncbi:hypothetical protein STA3757_11930 [Stanieria sp. NIES-3757]|nr:hypothetical protein STA3757_11930 [Stanieria sp. NIES-3757]
MALLLNNLLLNVVFVAFILTVAIWAIWTEIKSVNDYKKELELTEEAIKFLIDNQSKQEILTQKVEQKIIEWLSNHVDGEFKSSRFIPRIEHNYFVLLSYPTILSKPVPRSTVYFVPTLLTTLGIFGTFLGISLGIAGVDLENLSDPQAIVDASTQLLSGMKTAFLTSLAGLSGAIPLMFIIARQTKQKEKHRNQLRKALSEVAFLETSERLLSRFDHTSSRDAAKTLEEVAKNLKGLNQFHPDAIGNAVKQALASENSLLVQQLKEIQKLQKIQNEQFNSESIAQAINQELKLLISPISQKLEKIDYLVENTTGLPQLTPEAIAIQTKQQLEPYLTKLLANTTNLPQLTPEAIAQATTNKFTLLLNPIFKDLERLREIQETETQTIELLVQQLRNELIEPVVERLDQSANLTQEASEAVRELKNELGGITQSLAGAVETIQIFQKDTLTELQQFATSLHIILKDFREETKGVLEQVGSEINEAVAQSVAGMEAQRQAFAESANKAAKTFRGIREDLESALSTQAEQQKAMLEGVESQTRQILLETTAAFQDQSNTLKTVGQEASSLMNQAKDNLLGTLNNIDFMLQNTRQTVQQELERFRRDYQAALSEFFTQQNNLLNDTLGQQREGLAQVVANLQHTFDEEIQKRQEMSEQVNQSLAKIKQTVETVSNLANTFGLTSGERLGQLTELARTIGNEAHRVERAYQNMTNQFNDVLIQGNKQLFEYLQQVHESYSSNLTDFDLAAAQVCQKLNQNSHGLMSVAQYLVSAANELKNGKGSIES